MTYKLMIVDDSNIIRNRIARCEKGSLFQVVAKASNGLEAIHFFRRTHPDLVTMDLTMPHMDGLQCIQGLMRLNPDVKILVVSALSDKATGIRALKYGARGFLCKPFDEKKLLTAIQKVIAAD